MNIHVTDTVTARNRSCDPFGHQCTGQTCVNVTLMVTDQHKKQLRLREHRKAKKLSATAMAELLGIERESVLRQEREPKRVNPDKQKQWAKALGIELVDLWYPPHIKPAPRRPDLNDLFKDVATDKVIAIADMLPRLLKTLGE